MIERCRDAFPVRLMCRCLRVSASGYCDWSKRLVRCRQLDNERFLGRLREDSPGVLGAGRIREALVDDGESVSPNRAARLMAGGGSQGCSGAPGGGCNWLERDFTALEPESKRVTDVTEI